jgi:lycopene cyclase domain-containing protein
MSSFLYLWIDLAVIAPTLALSFDKHVAFYKQWPYVIPAILISALAFILWDIPFTEAGVWGFNPDYLVGIDFFGLPIEEHLFFICIPYSCIFLYECLRVYFPGFGKFNVGTTVWLGLAVLLGLFAMLNTDKSYTLINFLIGSVVLLLLLIFKPDWRNRFASFYLVALIPFLLVNGILTGAVTTEPIVWYNSEEILGIRLITIPLEDTVYCLSLLVIPIAIMERLRLGKSDTR